MGQEPASLWPGGSHHSRGLKAVPVSPLWGGDAALRFVF